MEKIVAATKAIIEPLPVSNSAEKYSPRKTALNPKVWVKIRQDLKLRPISCAVAAGVTNNAVTRRVPTTCTILTTTAAVMMLNMRPMPRTGSPWIRADRGSTVLASKDE